MLLADTSAWIEHLRGAESAVAYALLEAISRQEVIVIDPIILEVMAGARAAAVSRTQRVLESQHTAALSPRHDWLAAAAIYRMLRRHGISIRSQMDALIAAVAIRLDVEVLHSDRDFAAIEQHTRLRIAGV